MLNSAERAATWKELPLLALLAFALFLPGISSLPPVDRDEPRYAVATTQMLESHNFIDIRYQDQPRYLQPAGVYWLQALPTALFSAPEHRHIWTYRLPSLFGAVFASVFTAWMASLLFGRRIGLAAGVILAASVSLGLESRIGKTDAALLATVVTAQFALMRLYLHCAATWKAAAAFWIAIGLGVLLKGPIILMVVGLTVLALLLWDRKASWLKGLQSLWGVPLALLIAAPWYIAIGMVSHGQFFQTAIGHSMLGKVAAAQQAHGLPPGYHLALFPITFWPGSLLAVMAAPFAWRMRREPAVRFLLCWLIPSWIVFELIKTKLPHYVLPLFPAIACLTAMALFSPKVAVKPWLRWVFYVFSALWLVLSLVLGGFAPVALEALVAQINPLAIVLSILSLIAMGVLVWSVWRRKPEWTVAAVAGMTLFTAPNLYVLGLPHLTGFWLSPRIVSAEQAAERCPHSLLITTPYHEPSLVFLNGPSHTYLADTPANAADQLAKAGTCAAALVGTQQQPGFLARADALHLPLHPVGQVLGRNYSDNKTLTLTLYEAGPLPRASNGR